MPMSEFAPSSSAQQQPRAHTAPVGELARAAAERRSMCEEARANYAHVFSFYFGVNAETVDRTEVLDVLACSKLPELDLAHACTLADFDGDRRSSACQMRLKAA